MTFSGDDLAELTELVAQTWRSGADLDWLAPAGTLEWSCAKTADHAVDAVLAPAFFLASRNQHHYPAFEPFTLGTSASPETLIQGMQTATRILLAVVAAADPTVEAIIWQRPRPEVRGPADFIPRAGLELILHTHDVSLGLGVPFDPPKTLCERLRGHTKTWPMWTLPERSRLTMTGDPWEDLLNASGRTAAVVTETITQGGVTVDTVDLVPAERPKLDPV